MSKLICKLMLNTSLIILQYKRSKVDENNSGHASLCTFFKMKRLCPCLRSINQLLTASFFPNKAKKERFLQHFFICNFSNHRRHCGNERKSNLNYKFTVQCSRRNHRNVTIAINSITVVRSISKITSHQGFNFSS